MVGGIEAVSRLLGGRIVLRDVVFASVDEIPPPLDGVPPALDGPPPMDELPPALALVLVSATVESVQISALGEVGLFSVELDESAASRVCEQTGIEYESVESFAAEFAGALREPRLQMRTDGDVDLCLLFHVDSMDILSAPIILGRDGAVITRGLLAALQPHLSPAPAAAEATKRPAPVQPASDISFTVRRRKPTEAKRI
ncbi:hypothetical protein M885DRAFT_524028 [Pelagophyceae sp. CCMP2097]|nr:hypothetical protein M885DRAFT_524028 [Pelagophyceae sp. CCMP2097]|mmetsp:Transcript_19531/g.66983  ORF Transcript_19531/g.66983 Transcript_19531/m.66983 type:complete len:200 (-) Transcript_19531:2205-2804(-)